jgi:hypothetical protein
MATKVKGGFSTLKELDRHRRLCLGLPLPVWINGIVPWGYMFDPNDPTMAIPNDDQLRLLLKVKEYLKEYSYGDMSAWLTKAGYPISTMALHNLITMRMPFEEIVLPLEEREKL